ncbi:MAG: VWA domain-containing protein, partial [Planctomycetales bacterium]|nr:VWA domain-containing protein [Planctomycetales bacterium]
MSLRNPSRESVIIRKPRTAGRKAEFESLEDRRMLACRALPFNFNSVSFEQCFSQSFANNGTTYEVTTYYSEGNGTDDLTDDGLPGINANAQAMADESQAALQFYLNQGLNVLPAGDTEYEVFIAETPLTGTIASLDATWDSAWQDDDAIDNNDQLMKRLLAYHETQHLIQARYDSTPDWLFYGEGIARTIEDRVDTALDMDTGHLFIPEFNGVFGSDANRSSDLYTLRYRSVAWWTWLMDQYRNGPNADPPVTAANDLGWEALRDFYIELSSQPTDQTGAVNDFIAAQGSTFRDDFIDYTLALWAHKYNPADPRLDFIDTEIHNANALSGHNTHSGGPAYSTDFANLSPRSSQYWEFNPANQCEFTAFSFDGNGSNYGFSVMTVDGGNLVDRWTSYSNQWARTVRTADLDRIVGVVTSTGSSGTVDVGHGCVQPTLNIKSPTSAAFEMVGRADNPRTFIVRVDVTGKDGSGVAGLSADAFDVSIQKPGGGPVINANIVNSSYVLDDYWLLVQAPDDAAGAENGEFYNVTVSLGSVTDTEGSSILYTERVQDVVLVMDRSGSMGGSTGKIEAAQNAAFLLANELSDDDQGAFVAFDTDADLRIGLERMDNGSQRSDIVTAITNEVPLSATSIGDGLRTAATEHDNDGIAENMCSFILLSDGMENEPAFWADVQAEVTDNGCAIHTIALGPEANELLMQTISSSVPGGTHDYATTSGSVPINSTLTWEGNVSRIYDNIASKIGRRQRSMTALADSAIGGPATGVIDFEDQIVGLQMTVGDIREMSGVMVEATPFFFAPGQFTNEGFARIDDTTLSGGSDHEVVFNNINLDFQFEKQLEQIEFNFGAFGGQLNLSVNDELVILKSFSEVHGQNVGGAKVEIVAGSERRGVIRITGEIRQFSVGGQEFAVDNVRFNGSEGNYHPIFVDDLTDELVVSIAWQNKSTNHKTLLLDPSGDPVNDAFRRTSPAGTNDVWRVPAPQEGEYRLQVLNLPQEYFATASALSRYELHPFVGKPLEQPGLGAIVPIVAAFVADEKPITGANVTATVTDPVGGQHIVTLYDDGNHGDSEPNDGVYGNTFNATVYGDVVADKPDDGKEPAFVGSYVVNYLATVDKIRREAQESFVIEQSRDSDGDGMSDYWEEQNDLDPKENDARTDYDMDGVFAACEYQLGTDPNNSDTDGGGESDGSEIIFVPGQICRLGEQNPLDPSDDRTDSLQGVLVLAEATPNFQPYLRVIILPPVENELASVDIMRRAFDKSGRLVEDFVLVANDFDGNEFIDSKVSPELLYQYKVMPTMVATTNTNLSTGFEDLTEGTRLTIDQRLTSNGIGLVGQPFFLSDGSQTSRGIATVNAAGRNQSLFISNLNVDFQFGEQAAAFELLFGEFGGNVNLIVNGEVANVNSLFELDGKVLGRADVSVEQITRNTGRLLVRGRLNSIAIGGQEFEIDDVRILGAQQPFLVAGAIVYSQQVMPMGDPYAPIGSVLINGGNLGTTSRNVRLHIDASDLIRDGHDAFSGEPIPGSPTSELMMRISNSPDFGRTEFEPYQQEV